MENASSSPVGQIRTGIVPHAGIVYSGLTACHFYKILGKDYKRVIVIAPSHHFLSRHIIVPQSEIWETPIGNVKIDVRTASDICDDVIIADESLHMAEHAAEVQMPFIRYVLGDSVSVLPVIMGWQGLDAVQHLGDKLLNIIDSDTLVIASSDLYHGNNYDEALRTDRETMDHILNDKYSAFHEFVSAAGSACGGSCISTVKKINEALGLDINELHHITSADITGDYTGYTVGYCAFAGGKNAKQE